jgi:ABC-type multidrug transport system ATPase subunit
MSELSVAQLSFAYGSKQALQDVSFEIASGEFCALLGPNGAGKTTLFALLTRLFLPQQGHIRIAGLDLASNPRKALARMGVVFQQPTLDLDLTVWRNLTYYAALHGVSGRAAANASRLRSTVWECASVRRKRRGTSMAGTGGAWRLRARSFTSHRFCCWTSRRSG